MAELKLKSVYKVYDGGVKAVKDFNLDVKDKEFVVFVGPSGCGKSTTLRMIAGLESITAGDIYIDDVRINNIEPRDRDIAMVFQNYALYPHMTVYKNMAFSLKLRKVKREVLDKEGNKILITDKKEIRKALREYRFYERTITQIKKHIEKMESIDSLTEDELNLLKRNKDQLNEMIELSNKAKDRADYYTNHLVPKTRMVHLSKQEIDEKVKSSAALLEIEDLLDRKPKALSGGQRQRVAIGRAIVRNPKLFLMDEPLSNLDAKLRNQMRAELILLRQRINTTFIYVTHDQTEAMTLGDRIVIMKDGITQQIGTPQDLFEHPINLFVAGFIGSPQMNFIEGVLDENFKILLLGKEFSLDCETAKLLKEKDTKPQEIIVGIRPEHIQLADKDDDAFEGVITVVEVMGSSLHVHLDANNTKNIVIIVPLISITPEQQKEISIGKKIYFKRKKNLEHLFSKETTLNLNPLRGN